MARRRFRVRDIAEILEHWQAGTSIRSISRSLGICRNTVRKYVHAAQARGYYRDDPAPPYGWETFLKEVIPNPPDPLTRSVVFAMLFPYQEEIRKALTNNTAKSVWQRLHDEKGVIVSLSSFYRYLNRFLADVKNQSKPLTEIEPTRWMLQVLQNAYSFSNAKDELGEIKELKTLLENAASGQLKVRNRALSILARNRGIPFSTISQFLHISRKSVYRYLKCYQTDSFNASFTRQSSRLLKANDEENINAVFSLLHYPPSGFGINRTSWIIKDLKSCLEERGVCVSKQVISEIIKKAGYRWKKAKVVLTSNDPQYKHKLEHIKGILSSLSKDERFFSCDEFGPFAVKMKAGRRLAAPGEYPNVPQFQKSKGSLILTGALELSTNQVTHFYSKKKNTDEMIRLLDVLLKRYKGCTRIYLSWDAASWHISKKLNTRVDEVNAPSYRRKHKAAEVVIAPLPASAQFLNVIESVFSGMARAIIHNSNYGSVDEAKSAIDRYYKERNKHFQDHPKIAGKKIWGSERVPSQFDEARNCKDVKFR